MLWHFNDRSFLVLIIFLFIVLFIQIIVFLVVPFVTIVCFGLFQPYFDNNCYDSQRDS